MPVPLLNKPFSKWAQANIGVSIHLQEDFCVCSLPIKLVNIFCVVCRMPVGIINLGIPQCPFLHFAKSRVQVTSASEKSRLASVGRIFKFRGKKAHKQLMHKAFSLWHLYCLRVLVDLNQEYTNTSRKKIGLFLLIERQFGRRILRIRIHHVNKTLPGFDKTYRFLKGQLALVF